MDSKLLCPAPPPKTELERYRILSSTAGAKVSPLVLGGMSIGDAWPETIGPMTKDKSFELLDVFYDAGGNFIDTAPNYQNEQSETWIGEWMQKRGNRDQMFIATKFTTNYRYWELGKGGKTVNYTGNSRKTLNVAVKDSLRKLQTDYIDLLFVHYWDYTTNIEEVMDSLHMLVEQGKVLYLGVSNTPAWVVSAANTYARDHGKTPFSAYQGRWNVLRRDFERDIIPMARQFGMALLPWDVLGSGKIQSKKQIEARQAQGEVLRSTLAEDKTKGFAMTKLQSDKEERISGALQKVAMEFGEDVTVQQVALAYVMHKTRNVFPIVGGRKVEHLKDNIKGLGINLTKEQMKYLESVNEFDVGYPQDIMGDDPREQDEPSSTMILSAHVDYPRNGPAKRPLTMH